MARTYTLVSPESTQSINQTHSAASSIYVIRIHTTSPLRLTRTLRETFVQTADRGNLHLINQCKKPPSIQPTQAASVQTSDVRNLRPITRRKTPSSYQPMKVASVQSADARSLPPISRRKKPPSNQPTQYKPPSIQPIQERKSGLEGEWSRSFL